MNTLPMLMPIRRRNYKSGFDRVCSSIKNYCHNGCNIKVEGGKIWFVMHQIVETLSLNLSMEESLHTWLTIYQIINSMQCCDCRLYSLDWLNRISPPHNLPKTKDDWVREVFNHHNNVTRKIIDGAGGMSSKKLMKWEEYVEEMSRRRASCFSMEKQINPVTKHNLLATLNATIKMLEKL